MSQVTVKIPAQLRDTASGNATVDVSGETVGQALDAVFEAHPALKDRISDENGVRRFINLYVNGEDVRFLDGVNTATPPGCELTILPAVAGG